MNLYISSPDRQDAQLVADRLMDQAVSSVREGADTNVFSLNVNGCQIDMQSGAWKSSKASSQLMEKMDYEDDADDNDGYSGNTAKKSRLSSYESLCATLQSGQSSSKTFDPGSSQIYTRTFGSVEPEERRDCIGLNIFMMPWNTNVSSVVHRLFLILTGIHVVVINTESCRLKDYKEKFLKMLDSLWAFSKGEDIRFPKVIVAATTFTKDIEDSVSDDIASLFSTWIIGKPYEYQCQEHIDHVFLLSNVLRNDQTRELKTFIWRLLEKIEAPISVYDSITETLDALRKGNTQIIERKRIEIKHISNTAVEERLMEMHNKKEILYLHQMNPKCIVLDPEVLIISLNEILQRTNDDDQITFFKEMNLKNILRHTKNTPLIDIMCHVGILAKAVHSLTNENTFAISACHKAPDQLETLRQLPSQNDSPHVHSPILCLKFNELPLVSCVFQLIICQLLTKFCYDIQGKRCLIYNNFAAFRLPTESNEKQRLCVFTEGVYVFIYIIRYTKCAQEIEPTLCYRIKNVVEETLTKSLDTDIEKGSLSKDRMRTTCRVSNEKRQVEFEYMIRCPETKGVKINEEGLLNVKDLKNVADTENLQRRNVYHCCHHSDKAHPHELDVKPLLKVWFPEICRSHEQECSPLQKAESDATPSTSTINLCNEASEIKVTDKIAGKIADCIGHRWQMLAIELGVDQPTLDKIIYNNPRDVDKAITDMLMYCVNKRQGELTLKEVEECIKRVGVNINWEKFKNLYHNETSD